MTSHKASYRCAAAIAAAGGIALSKSELKDKPRVEYKEFGDKTKKVIILLHGNLMSWNQFMPLIPCMEQDYHIIAVSFDGFDGSGQTVYTTAQDQAAKLAEYIKRNLGGTVDCVYAESLGCGPAACLSIDKTVKVHQFILSGPEYMDCGCLNSIALRIMPKKQLKIARSAVAGSLSMPGWALKMMGQTQEGLDKMAAAVPPNISLESIRATWAVGLYLYREVDKMPVNTDAKVSCWYGEKERNMKKAIIKLKRLYPNLTQNCFKGYGHGEIINHPERLANELKELLR